MIATILGWLTSKIAGPIATGLAVLLAIGLSVQTVRIDGWPIFGGGLKAQVTTLQAQVKADTTQRQADRADANAAAAGGLRATVDLSQTADTQTDSLLAGLRAQSRILMESVNEQPETDSLARNPALAAYLDGLRRAETAAAD
jgi:hypothetical protein